MLTIVRSQIAAVLEPLTGLDAAAILNVLEIPKQLEHGHLAFPTFSLAKVRRQAPPKIAQELKEQLAASGLSILKNVEAVGGYLNVTFHDHYMQRVLVDSVLHQPLERIGVSTKGHGKRVVIDYASPNVAKPMHVGHLRAIMIGQAIRNLAQTQGYEVIGLNHLGDWGVQFGKLAWAYQNWGHEYPFAEKPFAALFQLYVRFHDEAEKNPELDGLGSAVFRQLENGDPEITRLWKMFVDITLSEDQKLFDILGVHHDLVRGESFYNDRLRAVEQMLEDKGLLVESQGAQVVMLDDRNMPPCLIRKSDGASLYATRDLASAIYRFDELKADLSLYVVGSSQSLHFAQVFAVLEKMGYPWVSKCHHIGFGLVKFSGTQAMSTRKGHVIFLEDVVNKAVELTREIIRAKNPSLENSETVAQQVGVGAVVFNDLVNDRIRDVEFDWQKVLDFEGDTGPYVQYCQVRCRSILKKAARQLPTQMPLELITSEERELVRLLLSYSDTLENAFINFKPNILAQYLLEVCHCFGHFYQKHRVLGGEPELETSRLILVTLVQRVVQAGLSVLNIQSPDVM
jgi:arginyl-tRNA synthetase